MQKWQLNSGFLLLTRSHYVVCQIINTPKATWGFETHRKDKGGDFKYEGMQATLQMMV